MFIAIHSFFCFFEELFLKEQKGSENMKASYNLEEISLEEAYKLYEKGFYLELTKNLLDEPYFIINREED